MHRDLKPANVLLYDGRWHAADFGMSRDLDVRTATETFQYGGTLLYWAPERWQDAGAALAALPAGPTAQGPLAAAALQHARRRQQQAAAQSHAVTAANAVAAGRRQALADLADICASAAELAQQDLPDLAWDSHGGIQRFSLDEISLEFILWDAIERHERLVLVGEVSTIVNNRRRCSANLEGYSASCIEMQGDYS